MSANDNGSIPDEKRYCRSNKYIEPSSPTSARDASIPSRTGLLRAGVLVDFSGDVDGRSIGR